MGHLCTSVLDIVFNQLVLAPMLWYLYIKFVLNRVHASASYQLECEPILLVLCLFPNHQIKISFAYDANRFFFLDDFTGFELTYLLEVSVFSQISYLYFPDLEHTSGRL